MKEKQLSLPLSSYCWAKTGTWGWTGRNNSSIPSPKKLCSESALRLPGCVGIVLFSTGTWADMMWATKVAQQLRNSKQCKSFHKAVLQRVFLLQHGISDSTDGALFICHWSIIHFILSPCIIIQFNTESKLHPSVTFTWQRDVVILLFTCKKIGYQLKNWNGLPMWRTFLIKFDSGIVNTNCYWVVCI